ncbi:unnamed protein product, partial [Laminaria digitata]
MGGSTCVTCTAAHSGCLCSQEPASYYVQRLGLSQSYFLQFVISPCLSVAVECLGFISCPLSEKIMKYNQPFSQPTPLLSDTSYIYIYTSHPIYYPRPTLP